MKKTETLSLLILSRDFHRNSKFFIVFFYLVFGFCFVLSDSLWIPRPFVRLSVCPFGQRPRRDRWPMLSHRANLSSFSSFFSSSFVPPPRFQPQGPNPSLKAQIPASRPKFQPQGPNPSLKPQIPALRLQFQPWGSNPSLEAQISAKRLKSLPLSSNPSFKAPIPASRLK